MEHMKTQNTPRMGKKGLPGTRRIQAVALLSGLLAAFASQAHEGEQHTTDASTPGLSASLGAGLRTLSADAPYPIARLPGVLEAGSALDDQRGTDLEYVELGMRAHFTPQLDGSLRLTYHGGEDSSTDVEALWLEARASEWGLAGRGGRQEVPIGFENMVHSHARMFGIAPLTMRAAVADEWIADGLRIDQALPGNFSIGAGLWNNQGYPGSDSNGLNLASLRAAWNEKPWKIKLAYAMTDADGRARLTTGQGGHTHSTPSCTGSISADRVCFDGDVGLLVLAAHWQPEDNPWWLGGEYWYKRETGHLDSIFGTPEYKGELEGGWLDLGYRVNSTLSFAARLEQMQTTNYLNGANAGLIATQAGIADAEQKPFGVGLVADWRPLPALRLVGEWHHYSDIYGALDNVFMLRAQVNFERELF